IRDNETPQILRVDRGSDTEIEAGEPIPFRIVVAENRSIDEPDRNVRVNFTHENGTSVNESIYDPANADQRLNTTTGPDRPFPTNNGTYADVVRTGTDGVLRRVGLWTYTVWVSDNATPAFGSTVTGGGATNVSIRVIDTTFPVITDLVVCSEDVTSCPTAGRVPTAEEGTWDRDTPVYVVARIVDQTLTDAKLRVVPPGGGAPIEVPLVAVNGTDLYRANRSFPTDGVWRLTLIATDDAGQTSVSSEFAVRVAERGPIVQDRTPGPIDSRGRGGWGKPRPTLSFRLFDVNEVDAPSVRVFVDDQLRTGLTLAPPESDQNIRVTLRLDEARYAEAGRTVTVRVESRDGKGLFENDTWTFRIDAKPPLAPTIEIGEPRGTTLAGNVVPVTRRTPITLRASDPDAEGLRLGSGVGLVELGFDNFSASLAAAGNPDPYILGPRDARLVGPEANVTVAIPLAGLADGAYRFRYAVEDQAGFRTPDDLSGFVPPSTAVSNLPKDERNRFYNASFFFVDNNGPALLHDASMVLHEPAGETIQVRITDPVGVASAKVFWRRAGTAFQESTLVVAEGDLFQVTLPPQPRQTRIDYRIEATDTLGNVNTTAVLAFDAANHPPSLVVRSPEPNDIVRGLVLVEWESRDVDGDPILVDLAYRRSNLTVYTGIRLNITQTALLGSFEWDTRDLPDGPVILRIQARDGVSSTPREVRVTVSNAAEPVAAVTTAGDRIGPGEPLKITAEVNRAALRVEAKILDENGDVVLTVPMNDEGTAGDETPGDGVWTALVTLDAKGSYSVRIFATFEDGTTFDKPGPEFRVAAGSAFRENLIPWIAIVVLFAVLVAVAAVAWKGR
ncbi:MAG: choice-of-anchor X domain-containing protein, partial [Methanobacteriota archaeon]